MTYKKVPFPQVGIFNDQIKETTARGKQHMDLCREDTQWLVDNQATTTISLNVIHHHLSPSGQGQFSQSQSL